MHHIAWQIRFLSLNFNSSQFPFRFLEIVCIHRLSIKIMDAIVPPTAALWWEIFSLFDLIEEISRLPTLSWVNNVLFMSMCSQCVLCIWAVECRYIHCFACAADFLTFLLSISSFESLLITNLKVNYVCNEHFLACIWFGCLFVGTIGGKVLFTQEPIRLAVKKIISCGW